MPPRASMDSTTTYIPRTEMTNGYQNECLKALAEGKTIQLKVMGEWHDLSRYKVLLDFAHNTSPDHRYRVKPDNE